MAICERCGRPIPEGSEFCGYCGRPGPRTSGGFRALVVALLLLGAAAGLYVYFAHHYRTDAEATRHEQIASLYHTARNYEDNGEYEAAARAYGEVVALTPARPFHRRNLARVLLRLGRFSEAQTHLEAAIDEELAGPAPNDSLLFGLYQDSALAYVGQQQYHAGGRALEQAREQRPGFEQTPLYLVPKAIAAAGRGRGDTAHQLLRQALAADRDLTLRSVSTWLELVPDAPETPLLQQFLDETGQEDES